MFTCLILGAFCRKKIASTRFRWKIDNFSNVDSEELYSDIFEIRFILSVINQTDSAKTVKRETDHEFTASWRSWGFQEMLSLDRLNSFDEGFLVNDTIIVEEPNQEEAAKGSSSFAEFDTLFADIHQKLLKGKTFENETSSNSQRRLPSAEELSHAKKVLTECFSVNFANVMLNRRRKLELKNALSITCHVFSDSEKMAIEMTKFVADFDQICKQYVSAQDDLEEAKEMENSVGKLKTTLKQLYDEFIPVRDRSEEVEQEIVNLEKQLRERKAEKARLKNDLEVLAGRASTSKQALIGAEQSMKLFMPEKELAKKLIDYIEKSWESFKSLFSNVLR
ncbi:hypothetical protein UlMin_025260 [Ulmus minor]